MTKDEIIDSVLISDIPEPDERVIFTKNEMLRGMDKYGKQEAISFAIWLQENRWFNFTEDKWHYTFEQGTSMPKKTYEKHYIKTSEELYLLYQESLINKV